MSVDSSVKIEGFQELFKAMDELSEEIGKGKTDSIWRNALTQAFEPVLEAAKSRAPRDTGQLVDHMYLKAHRPQNRDKASKYYETGETWMVRVTASPRREESIKKTFLTKRGKFKDYFVNPPVAVSQEFGNAKTSAHPFMRISLESNASQVFSRLGQILWAEINWGKYAKKV